MKPDTGNIQRFIFWAVSAAGLIAVDQVTKWVAGLYLSGRGIVNVLGSYVIFEYIKNRGGFLSFGHGSGNILWIAGFVVIPLIVLIAISVYVFVKKIRDKFFLTVWVLILSGGFGNIIDRIFEGKVTDFMNIGVGTFRTGIFNVADLYIVICVVVIAIKLIKSTKKQPVETNE